MNDLVKRLREGEDGLEYAAADEIERLQTALQGTLAAMEAMVTNELTDSEISRLWNAAIEQGEAALGEGGEDENT
jgi:hypothetical protein